MKNTKLGLLSDIGGLIKALDGEIDAYIASRTEKELIRRKLLGEIFLKRKKENITLSKRLTAKYGQTENI